MESIVVQGEVQARDIIGNHGHVDGKLLILAILQTQYWENIYMKAIAGYLEVILMLKKAVKE